MSQIFCHDCKRNIPPSRPRLVYTVVVEAEGERREAQVYVCGDCEYERQMKPAWK